MTWCPDVNSGLYVQKQSENGVKLGFCCVSELSEVVNSVDLNNQWLNSQRSQLFPSACARCVNDEAQGMSSRRLSVIDFYRFENIPSDRNVLVNLDYNCENICNAKCIMCGSFHSSLWLEDEKKLNVIEIHNRPHAQRTKHNNLVYNLDFSNLKRLHFNGGEPFLSQDHQTLMEKVINCGAAADCHLSYNTNGSIIPSIEIRRLWKKFKVVKLQFSIDAIDRAFNYIRFPLDWKQLVENLEYWKSFDEFNILYAINVTIGLHNVLYLKDLLEWQVNNFSSNKQNDQVEITAQLVYHRILNLGYLPYKHRDAAKDILLLLRNKSLGISDQVLNTTNPNDKWIDYLNSLDSLRGTCWKDSLSRLI